MCSVWQSRCYIIDIPIQRHISSPHTIPLLAQVRSHSNYLHWSICREVPVNSVHLGYCRKHTQRYKLFLCAAHRSVNNKCVDMCLKPLSIHRRTTRRLKKSLTGCDDVDEKASLAAGLTRSYQHSFSFSQLAAANPNCRLTVLALFAFFTACSCYFHNIRVSVSIWCVILYINMINICSYSSLFLIGCSFSYR